MLQKLLPKRWEKGRRATEAMMMGVVTKKMEMTIITKTGKKAKKKKENAKKTNALTTLLLRNMLHSDFQMTKSFAISMGANTPTGMKHRQHAG